MEKELRRNVFHLLFGIFFALIVLKLQHEIALILLALLIIIATLLSEAALRGKKLGVLRWFLRVFEREKVRPGLGVINFLIGSFLSLVFFSSQIAFLSILVLAFNDSFSTVVGIAFGRHKIKGKKTLEGSIGGFLGTVLIMAFFIPSIWEVLLISLTATVIELFSILDDNLIIPPTISLLIKIIQ